MFQEHNDADLLVKMCGLLLGPMSLFLRECSIGPNNLPHGCIIAGRLEGESEAPTYTLGVAFEDTADGVKEAKTAATLEKEALSEFNCFSLINRMPCRLWMCHSASARCCNKGQESSIHSV